MPLYEYQCESCSHRFEVIQKYSDAPIDTCPKCGGAVAKLLSSPAIQFKGTGWYITDYARAGKPDTGGDSDRSSSSQKSAEGAKGGSEGGSDSKADSKSDSKSDSKAESKSDKGGGSSGDGKPSNGAKAS